MNQEKVQRAVQVFYNERWVDKEHFRAFVYRDNEQKLAKNYKEYEDLLASGLWFATKDQPIEAVKKRLDEIDEEIKQLDQENAVVVELKKKARKPKHGANS